MRPVAGLLLAGLLGLGLPAACAVPGTTPRGGPTAVATAAPGEIVRVRFDHVAGRPAGPVRTVVVPRGATVDLVVGSDVARRIVVPELGRARDVTAGGTVTIRFLALGTLSVRITTDDDAVRDGTVIGRVEPRTL